MLPTAAQILRDRKKKENYYIRRLESGWPWEQFTHRRDETLSWTPVGNYIAVALATTLQQGTVTSSDINTGDPGAEADQGTLAEKCRFGQKQKGNYPKSLSLL